MDLKKIITVNNKQDQRISERNRSKTRRWTGYKLAPAALKQAWKRYLEVYQKFKIKCYHFKIWCLTLRFFILFCMRSSFFKFLFASFLIIYATASQAQTLKLDELIACFNGPKYPACVFEMVEGKGFNRIDKQWLPKCDRVIYYLEVNGSPSIFVSPMNCFEMQRSTHFPKYYRNEMEVQFQKSSRKEFETLKAEVKKQCKFLGAQKGSESGNNVPGSSQAYRQEATGITFIVEDSEKAAFIYLIK